MTRQNKSVHTAPALPVGLFVLVAAVAIGAARASAQSATGFIGNVSVNGQPAAAGTTVEVFVDGVSLGSAKVAVAGAYVVDLSDATATLDSKKSGATVTFAVNGIVARETSTFQPALFKQVDLSIVQS